MANQLYALTGRRSRPTYVDEINARTPYLRGLVQQRKDDQYNTDMFNLEKDKLDQSITNAKDSLALQEKQGKRANALGVLGLGGNLWLGSRRNSDLKDMIEGESKSNLTGGAPKTDLGAPAMGAADVTSPSGFSFDKAVSPSSYKGAVTSPSTWVSGVGGGLVGAEAGEVIGEAIGVGGTNERRAVGGALGGAASEYFINGGDIYSTIFSGLIGGATGLFSKNLF
jgi:hypothetical protein